MCKSDRFLLFLLPLLLTSCSDSVATSQLRTSSPESAQFEIQIPGSSLTSSVALNAGSPLSRGTHSFSSSESAGLNHATSVSHCYVGQIDFEDAYDRGHGRTTGHVLAFRISLHNPTTNEALFDKIAYAVYNGKEVVCFDEQSVKVTVRPPSELDR